MKWKIKYSEQVIEDLKAIYEYIAFEICAPHAAKNQVNQIINRIDQLEIMPRMVKAYEEEPWKSKGYRVFPVNHYLVLYLPKEEDLTVNVIRIFYGGRDIHKQLEEIENP